MLVWRTIHYQTKINKNFKYVQKLFSNTYHMTLVKKTKKPKAKKAGKKPVKKTVFSGAKGSARIEKIDRRLRPTPEPKLVKIDPMLKNPLKIVDVPRTQIPTYMFSGQDSSNLIKQFDLLNSREKELENKFLNLQQELKKEKNEKKNLEVYSQIQDLSIRAENLKNNIGNENYDEIKKEINELLKDKTLDSTYYDILIDLKKELTKEQTENIKDYFKETKQTNTILDDVIVQNDLIDEVKEVKKKGRKKKTETKIDDIINENNLVDKQLVVESYLNDPDPLKEIFKKAEAKGLLDD